MSKYSNKKILIIILGILVVTIFSRFFNLFYFPDSSPVLEKGTLIPLQPKEALTQNFTANRDNLSKMEFLLRTPGIKPGDSLKIEIAEKDCQKIIRTGELQKTFLNSDNLYAINFSTISDSKGKTYCMKATFKPQQKSDTKKLQLFTMDSKSVTSSLTNLTTGEVFSDKLLSMRPVYTNNHWWQDFSELNQRMSQYRPWFLKSIFLALIVFGFVIISILAITLLVLL